MLSEPLLIEALSRGGPWAAAVLAAGFSLWKWILPAIKDLRETSAKITAAEAAQLPRLCGGRLRLLRRLLPLRLSATQTSRLGSPLFQRFQSWLQALACTGLRAQARLSLRCGIPQEQQLLQAQW